MHLLLQAPIQPLRDTHKLQVTRTFHQESMPFSAQCYGFADDNSRRAREVDAALRAPVRSEEIGADWEDVFQRLQVVPLTYNIPQVTVVVA